MSKISMVIEAKQALTRSRSTFNQGTRPSSCCCAAAVNLPISPLSTLSVRIGSSTRGRYLTEPAPKRQHCNGSPLDSPMLLVL